MNQNGSVLVYVMTKMNKVNTAIVLLGGNGIRLKPLTLTMNKHMLPIYDKTLAQIAVDFLLELGIKRIIAVIKKEDLDRYKRLFEIYKTKLKIEFVFQELPLGTAHAIKLCEEKLKDENCFVTYWGDNVFEFVDRKLLQKRLGVHKARIHIASVKDPENYGVIEVKHNKIISIEDKPSRPKSNLICVDFMLFSNNVFDEIDKISKNKKQEWDIMDAIRSFHEDGTLGYQTISGKWFDAGVSVEALFKVAEFARKYRINKRNA